MTNINNHPPLAIDVRHLTKEFNGKKAVDDFSMQVKAGEIFGFLGPNGSGKTTTIRLLCGLLTPSSGEGTCLGYDIITQSKLIKLQVGYMTQKFSLYEDLTVRENLDFVARMYDLQPRQQIVQSCIDRLGIGHERQNQVAGQLSGGWKQRLALAAATLHNPKLLLLDEPTAGVDPKARREFWEQLHILASAGVTVLVTTHYMDEAERCSRLAYISYGKLLAQGTPLELIATAKLTTWEVTGKNLPAIEQQLRQLSKYLEVTAFGQSLHINSTQAEKLQQVLLPYQQHQDYQWRLIAPSLEDVFIYFMRTAEDTFK